MFKNTETLREAIQKFKLQRLEEKLISLAKPVIAMRTTAVDEQAVPLGASKLGGLPDLPADFRWPYRAAKPLTFIGQFRLADIALLDTAEHLPPYGRLYFFFDADEVPWGMASERDGWQVVFLEDETLPLVRTPHPTTEGVWGLIRPLPPHRIDYERGLSLPPIYWSEQTDYGIEFINFPGDDQDLNPPSENTAYFSMLNNVYPEPRHFWFGHPDINQRSVEWDAVTLSQGLQPQLMGQSGYSAEQIADVRSQMEQWQFLFQIGSDDSLNVIWGDVGTLYVCIPKTSLAARRFEDCWTILQS